MEEGDKTDQVVEHKRRKQQRRSYEVDGGVAADKLHKRLQNRGRLKKKPDKLNL